MIHRQSTLFRHESDDDFATLDKFISRAPDVE
jgi:hypothetical protein